MARCKNAPETVGRTNPLVQIKFFEDDEAKARYQTVKGRQNLSEKEKGEGTYECPATPVVEIDSEETTALEEEEEPQRTPTPPLAPTLIRRRGTKRTDERILVEEDKPQASPMAVDSEEEVQSGAGEED
ncbi:hypothetical protein GQ457_02G024620 [Hibiscus cannabinus]